MSAGLISLLLTRRAAAALLAVSPATIDRLVKDGQLPAVRIGGSVRFELNDLEAFIDRQKGER